MINPKAFSSDKNGAAMVEFTLIFPMLLILTFAIVEFGLFFWQYNSAEKATQIGVRAVATRSSIVTTWTSDCGQVATSAALGTPCNTIAGSDTWTLTCDGAALASYCDGVVMGQIVTQMQTFFPRLVIEDVRIDFKGSGFGFVGRGSPVPLVSVSLQGMTYDFVVIDTLLGWTGIINMPPFTATIIGEDLAG
jgi:hypothetical protein